MPKRKLEVTRYQNKRAAICFQSLFSLPISVEKGPPRASEERERLVANTIASTKPRISRTTEIDHRLGFFNLPREIRDVIYGYSIISMKDHKWKAPTGSLWEGFKVCSCNKPWLPIYSAHPPYFIRSEVDCPIPDQWLYSVSLISKQFATELRATLFQKTAFSIRNEDGQYKISLYKQFIRTLGPEAQELRRLMVAISSYELDRDGTYDIIFKDNLEVGDVEAELEHFRGLLHENIDLFLTIDHTAMGKTRELFFHCTSDTNEERPVVARKLDFGAYPEWLEYLKRVTQAPAIFDLGEMQSDK